MAQILVYISPIFALVVIVYCFYRLVFDCKKFRTAFHHSRGRRQRHFRRRRLAGRRGIVPPSPEVPPPSYDIEGNRLAVPNVFIIPANTSLPKYEDALGLPDAKPPSYTVAFVCEELLPPSYDRARSHTNYIIANGSPTAYRSGSLRRTYSLPHCSSPSVSADSHSPVTLNPGTLPTSDCCHL